MQRQRGLTLLELLVVLSIIGLTMAGVSLSLRDSSQTQLEREAQRLVAHLEAARAQSRTSGIAQVWRITPAGYAIVRLPAQADAPVRQEVWLSTNTQAHIQPRPNTAGNAALSNVVVLGPEPIILPASITLSVSNTATHTTRATPTLRIATDGLTPFQVVP
jgi:general secretion pathway protein H